MFQHVAYRVSLETITKMAEEFFGIRIFQYEMHLLKALMASYYTTTSQQLLQHMLSGPLLHVDETEVKLQRGKGLRSPCRPLSATQNNGYRLQTLMSSVS